MKTYKITKIAMSVPAPSPQDAESMKQHGIFVLQDMLKRMPHTTQKDMFSAIQNSGATEFFRNLDVKTVIQLPAVYVVDPKEMFEFNGKAYFAIEVAEPRIVGKKWTSMSGTEYKKGDQYDGEVLALDIQTGLPVPLPLPQVNSKITTPTGNRESLLQKVNQEVEKYNERLSTITKAVGASILPMQILRAELKVNERLATLQKMKEAIENKLQMSSNLPKNTYDGYLNSLRDQVQNGRLNIRDVYDTVIYLYQSNPDALINGINSGSISVPEELKIGLIAIAEQEKTGIASEKSKKEQEQREREERIR